MSGHLTEETHGRYVDSVWNSDNTFLFRIAKDRPTGRVGGSISNLLRGRMIDQIQRHETRLIIRCSDCYEIWLAWIDEDGNELEGRPQIVSVKPDGITVAWVNERGIALNGKPSVVRQVTRILANKGSLGSKFR